MWIIVVSNDKSEYRDNKISNLFGFGNEVVEVYLHKNKYKYSSTSLMFATIFKIEKLNFR